MKISGSIQVSPFMAILGTMKYVFQNNELCISEPKEGKVTAVCLV